MLLFHFATQMRVPMGPHGSPWVPQDLRPTQQTFLENKNYRRRSQLNRHLTSTFIGDCGDFWLRISARPADELADLHSGNQTWQWKIHPLYMIFPWKPLFLHRLPLWAMPHRMQNMTWVMRLEISVSPSMAHSLHTVDGRNPMNSWGFVPIIIQFFIVFHS